MKVLWVCNAIPACVAEGAGLKEKTDGVWLEGLARFADQDSDIEIAICANYQGGTSDILKASWGQKSIFYGFRNREREPHRYDSSLDGIFQRIIRDFSPDILHLFGSEYAHALAAAKAFGNPQRTVLHIQGLISVCAGHYADRMPDRIVRRWTFRDMVRRDNILMQQKKFYARGEFEKETFQKVGIATGRTEWDRACSQELNPKAEYVHIQEMMREVFYEGGWSRSGCQKYRIFMSQGGYPVKGLHIMLEALPMLVKRFPETRLYIAGANGMKDNAGIVRKIRRSSYAKYIQQLIRKYGLSRYVVFTGNLSAERMKEQYLLANVFVSPSLIENSPNSIGEALLLGTPVVASDVGGVSSIMTHGREGYLYPAGEPYMLRHYVSEIFENGALACEMSMREKVRADVQYDRKRIWEDTKGVYRKVTERLFI